MAEEFDIWQWLQGELEAARRFQESVEGDPEWAELKAIAPAGFFAMRRLVIPLDEEQVRAMRDGAVPVILQPDGSWETLDPELQAESLVICWQGDEADRQLNTLRHGARLVLRGPDGAILDLDLQSSLVD